MSYYDSSPSQSGVESDRDDFSSSTDSSRPPSAPQQNVKPQSANSNKSSSSSSSSSSNKQRSRQSSQQMQYPPPPPPLSPHPQTPSNNNNNNNNINNNNSTMQQLPPRSPSAAAAAAAAAVSGQQQQQQPQQPQITSTNQSVTYHTTNINITNTPPTSSNNKGINGGDSPAATFAAAALSPNVLREYFPSLNLNDSITGVGGNPVVPGPAPSPRGRGGSVGDQSYFGSNSLAPPSPSANSINSNSSNASTSLISPTTAAATFTTFQTHAYTTVQNLAASFGHISSILQKDQIHSIQEEEVVKKKLNGLQQTCDTLLQQNRDLHSLFTRTQEKNAQEKRDLQDRLLTLNNKIIVGLSVAGVDTTALPFQQVREVAEEMGLGFDGDFSNGGSVLPSPSSAAMSATGGGISGISTSSLSVPSSSSFRPVAYSSDRSTQLLLDRMVRLEHELHVTNRRLIESQLQTSKYASEVQQQMKKSNEVTIKLIGQCEERCAAAVNGDGSLGSSVAPTSTPAIRMLEKDKIQLGMKTAFNEIPLAKYEVDATLIGAANSSIGSTPSPSSYLSTFLPSFSLPPSISLTPELHSFLYTVQTQVNDARTRMEALVEMCVPEGKEQEWWGKVKEVVERENGTAGEAAGVARQTTTMIVDTATADPSVSSSPYLRSLAASPMSRFQQPLQSQLATPSAAAQQQQGFSLSPSPRNLNGPLAITQSIPPYSAYNNNLLGSHNPTNSKPSTDFSFTPRTAFNATLEHLRGIGIGAGGGVNGAADGSGTSASSSAEHLAHQTEQYAKQVLDIYNSIIFMKENGSLNGGLNVTDNATTPADALTDPSTSSSSPNLSSVLIKKLNDKISLQDRSLLKLDSTLISVCNQLTDVQKTIQQQKEIQSSSLTHLSSDFTSILSQFSSLSRQFSSQHKILDGRLSTYREEFDTAIKYSLEALEKVERSLEKKADVKLVLDKISRSEYQTTISKLKSQDDEILQRTVLREEYRSTLNELKSTLNEDQRDRYDNLQKIMYELQKCCDGMEGKANKSDFIALSTMLDSLPNVHEQVTQLKTHITSELNQRTSEIFEQTIDRKQLKRSMQKLMKGLQEELNKSVGGIGGGTNPNGNSITCDVCCARRTGSSGTSCLSCASQMKMNQRIQALTGGFTGNPSSSSAAPSSAGQSGAMVGGGGDEVITSRGGGFVVTTSNSAPGASIAGSSRGTTSSGSRHKPSSSQSSSRPMTTPNKTPSASSSLLPPANGAVSIDHFPIPGNNNISPTSSISPSNAQQQPLSARSEVGSDGRIYSSRGMRTHRLVSNSTKSKARQQEEDGDSSAASWREEKNEESDTVMNMQANKQQNTRVRGVR